MTLIEGFTCFVDGEVDIVTIASRDPHGPSRCLSKTVCMHRVTTEASGRYVVRLAEEAGVCPIEVVVDTSLFS